MREIKEDAIKQAGKPNKSIVEIMSNESKKQRRKRYTAHLQYLMKSKKEDMKRSLQDLIDSIHDEEQCDL